MQRTVDGALRRMPMVKIVVPFVVGILFAQLFTLSVGLSLVFLAVWLCLLVVFHILAKYFVWLQTTVSLLFLLGCLFCGYTLALQTQQRFVALENNVKHRVIATIIDAPITKPKTVKALLRVNFEKKNNTWLEKQSNIIAYISKDSASKKLDVGDQIILNAYSNDIENYSTNAGNFNYKSYLHNKHIYNSMYVPSYGWKIVSKSGFTFKKLTITIRNTIDSIYKSCGFSNDEQSVLSALILGIRTGVSQEILQNYSVTGAMHILAVSGLHVGILYLVLSWLFSLLRGRWKGILIILIIWMYAFITGFSPSIERAAIMFSLITIAKDFRLHANIYNTLAASAVISLIINPFDLFDVGFQLSYMAVFGIVYCNSLFKKLYSPENTVVKYVWEMCYVSVAAQIFTLPFTLYYFGTFPLYFIFTNIIAIPLSFVVMILALSILPLYFISMPVFLLIAKLLGISISLQNGYLALIASFPLASIPVQINLLDSVFISFCICLAMFFYERRKFIMQ